MNIKKTELTSLLNSNENSNQPSMISTPTRFLPKVEKNPEKLFLLNIKNEKALEKESDISDKFQMKKSLK
jgi:hypothetical protein